MPILKIKIAAAETRELTAAVAATLLELSSRILHKPPEVTAIVIDYVSPERWIIGGRPLAEQGLGSFFLDLRITDETNTKAEKAQYIRETFAAFAGLLGGIHEESYIHVHDVRATAYGYGGLTQEYRYQH